MNIFIESHLLWIRKMIEAKVEFIIIGGYSVIFHGYKRTTGDMDIWLKPDNDNKAKLLPVLFASGFEEEDVQGIADMDFTKHLVFSVGEVPDKIDFLTRISFINYDEADTKKIIADQEGLKIPFLHLNDLILSKMNTGRLKDKADIDMLQQVANSKGAS